MEKKSNLSGDRTRVYWITRQAHEIFFMKIFETEINQITVFLECSNVDISKFMGQTQTGNNRKLTQAVSAYSYLFLPYTYVWWLQWCFDDSALDYQT